MENNIESYEVITKHICHTWKKDEVISYIDNVIHSNWDNISKEAKLELFFLLDILKLKQPELERDYTHIIEKLQSFWNSDLCEEYLESLIIDTHGLHQVFPESVFWEIVFLKNIFKILKTDNSVEFKNWHISNRNTKII